MDMSRIVYELDANGGFTVGDLDTGITCYAYPTSLHAMSAKKHPASVARYMLADGLRWAEPRGELSIALDKRRMERLRAYGILAFIEDNHAKLAVKAEKED
jgi:hypothetical protein